MQFNDHHAMLCMTQIASYTIHFERHITLCIAIHSGKHCCKEQKVLEFRHNTSCEHILHFGKRKLNV
jgi:hypothetical protein